MIYYTVIWCWWWSTAPLSVSFALIIATARVGVRRRGCGRWLDWVTLISYTWSWSFITWGGRGWRRRGWDVGIKPFVTVILFHPIVVSGSWRKCGRSKVLVSVVLLFLDSISELFWGRWIGWRAERGWKVAIVSGRVRCGFRSQGWFAGMVIAFPLVSHVCLVANISPSGVPDDLDPEIRLFECHKKLKATWGNWESSRDVFGPFWTKVLMI